jgi:hypothetical protein
MNRDFYRDLDGDLNRDRYEVRNVLYYRIWLLLFNCDVVRFGNRNQEWLVYYNRHRDVHGVRHVLDVLHGVRLGHRDVHIYDLLDHEGSVMGHFGVVTWLTPSFLPANLARFLSKGTAFLGLRLRRLQGVRRFLLFLGYGFRQGRGFFHLRRFFLGCHRYEAKQKTHLQSKMHFIMTEEINTSKYCSFAIL